MVHNYYYILLHAHLHPPTHTHTHPHTHSSWQSYWADYKPHLFLHHYSLLDPCPHQLTKRDHHRLYHPIATSMSRNHSYSADGDTLELELMGLRGYTVYNFSEAAETTGGRGQPLVVTSRTPQGGGYLGSNIKWCTCICMLCVCSPKNNGYFLAGVKFSIYYSVAVTYM